MNIVNKLTLRQLKLNKKRTLITIIGVIISTAMITAVAALGSSFMDLMQRQTMANEGKWHVLYNDVNKTQLEAIQEDEATKTLILEKDLGYAPLEGSENPNKPYLFMKAYNPAGFENFPIVLSEGRLPQTPDELVISEAILTNAKIAYKIGDTLNLDIGERYVQNTEEDQPALTQTVSLRKDEEGIQEALTKESTKTYSIVGIIERPLWEPTWAPGYTVLSYIDEGHMDLEETVSARVIVGRIEAAIFENGARLAAQNDIKEVGFNHSLLRYYGVVKDDLLRGMLFNLSAIIIGIIMIGSVALIYNAFAISVSERSRHLGMLASVGATKVQKRNSVFFEGAVIGAISIPIGIIAGFIGIGVTFLCINPVVKETLPITETFRVVILPSSLIVAAAISAVTILISTYRPARKASRISAIDAIRQTADVKFTDQSVKTYKLTRSLFGIEGDLALKNLKRNKKRYKATVFSLIISMVLFLVVSSFTAGLKKALVLSQDGINFDLEVTVESEDKEAREAVIRQIGLLSHITQLAQVDSLDAYTWIPEEAIAEYLKGTSEEALQDSKYPYHVVINVLNDEDLRRYAQEAGINFNLLKDTKKLPAVVVDTIKYKDITLDKYIETKAVKTSLGEKLDLSYYDSEREEKMPLGSVEIAALTHKMPDGVRGLGANSSFHIIISQDVFNRVAAGNDMAQKGISQRLYIKSDNPLRLQEEIEALQSTAIGTNIYLYNVFVARQREEQMIFLMSIFTYAFILLITSICAANIFNTISTSIALRKREFAMLKSVGMTPKSFNRMISYESIFYGIKALIYGLPISLLVIYLMHRTLMAKFSFEFAIPWMSMGITIGAVFIIVGAAMLYASAKVKKENIIDALKQEII
ncbi:FtsX-like permease family protein [Cellulosilyticum sp. I15G10I2]|uniref:FtsX-like permease family protein n=1 Tax=Cellulosilyticum sp. I15G10I2 TaxID=1892843 RepID=UPI00085BDE57|nr:FtsX-like permease family protein [Cellulosilyticum sp. I15G10I2]